MVANTLRNIIVVGGSFVGRVSSSTIALTTVWSIF